MAAHDGSRRGRPSGPLCRLQQRSWITSLSSYPQLHLWLAATLRLPPVSCALLRPDMAAEARRSPAEAPPPFFVVAATNCRCHCTVDHNRISPRTNHPQRTWQKASDPASRRRTVQSCGREFSVLSRPPEQNAFPRNFWSLPPNHGQRRRRWRLKRRVSLARQYLCYCD